MTVRTVLVFALIACRGTERPRATPVKLDPHSHAQPNRVAVRHLSLELTVDFARKTLAGKAVLSFVRHDSTARELVLDSNGLVIEAVTDCQTHQPLAHTLGAREKVTAQALSIALPARGDCIDVAYHTGPDAGALLWVEPSGTSGKVHPMLFTQSQAILARTWIPLQDTPGVRFTYDATIHVPAGQWALMSAENPQHVAPDGTYRFAMTQPIPSYLMALAVGDFAFRPIGPRTGVYAEPADVDAAAHEFGEVDAMVATAEKLYGPYRWGRYDMLVLPPSFPFGGMENPRLSFLTPTAITGDKSLVSLIAHELAHSWSGNLVTNATWNDFWLNEGMTTYVERRIMEELHGHDVTDVDWALGRRDLDKTLDELGRTNPDTRLGLDFGPDREPDDAPTNIAYEKGALLLRTLEETFGRATFDAFLRQRFDRRAFQSTDTDQLETELTRELVAKHPEAAGKLDLAAWLHGPGLPASAAPAPSTHVDQLEQLAKGFATTGVVPAAVGPTLDWVVFLRALPADLGRAKLAALDAKFHLMGSTNAEIAMHWLPLAIRADMREAVPFVEKFLVTIGRLRMVRPVYDALLAGSPFWKTLAATVFERAKPLYHSVTRDAIAKRIVGLPVSE